MGRVFVVLGSLACLLDGFTTWAGLRESGHFYERTPFMAELISSLGLNVTVVASVVIRVGVFCFLAACLRRFSGWRRDALAGLGLAAVCSVWLIVLSNIFV